MVNWPAGVPPKQKELWCIVCGGVLGTIVCVELFLKIAFPRFLFIFFSESSTLQLPTYLFSQLGHYTGDDKMLPDIFLHYKTFAGV